jgi:hypothetical protein
MDYRVLFGTIFCLLFGILVAGYYYGYFVKQPSSSPAPSIAPKVAEDCSTYKARIADLERQVLVLNDEVQRATNLRKAGEVDAQHAADKLVRTEEMMRNTESQLARVNQRLSMTSSSNTGLIRDAQEARSKLAGVDEEMMRLRAERHGLWQCCNRGRTIVPHCEQAPLAGSLSVGHYI